MNNLILDILFLTFNNINLFINITRPRLCLLITIVLLLIYLYLYNTNTKSKIRIILILILFSLCTIMGELYVMKYTDLSLIKYYREDIKRAPIWLFSAYASMAISVLFFNNLLIEKLDFK